MIFLYILLAIVLLFVIILNIKVHLIAEYDEKIYFTIKYAFFKFELLPVDSKKKKKAIEEQTIEPPKEQTAKPAKAKRNILKDFYEAEGIDGILLLLKKTAEIMSGFFKHFFKHFIVEDLFLDIKVASTDAANTALKYGKISSVVFASVGTICANAKVKKYNVNVSPDFLDNKTTGQFYSKCSFRPSVLINAGIVMAVKLFFKVLLKLLKTKPQQEENADANNISEETQATA
ncbi:MAG: DUF2953 domain-containing protein [Clostridiales bacterium]|nr:DUF2953 domain-containing protein [Clostridiales bacterium]